MKKPLVVVVASQKGGAGKTTLSGHFAVAALMAGAQGVALFDTDPQGSLSHWINDRKAEEPAFINATIREIPGQVEALGQAGYQWAIIDTPPSMTQRIEEVVRLADLVVIPVRPSVHDLRAAAETVAMVQDAGKPFLFVLTQVKANANQTAQAAAHLSEHGQVAKTFVGDRVDFSTSMNDGRTVMETAPRSRSAGEIRSLWEQVSGLVLARDKEKVEA
jgi:chromosome partitioning protein